MYFSHSVDWYNPNHTHINPNHTHINPNYTHINPNHTHLSANFQYSATNSESLSRVKVAYGTWNWTPTKWEVHLYALYANNLVHPALTKAFLSTSATPPPWA